MKRACHGICDRFKSTKPNNTGLYINGHKRCNICEIYIKTIENKCPCCNNILRNRPRNGRYKEPFRKYIQEVQN